MSDSGVPSDQSSAVYASASEQPRCPHCRKWVADDNVCRYEHCDRNGLEINPVQGDEYATMEGVDNTLRDASILSGVVRNHRLDISGHKLSKPMLTMLHNANLGIQGLPSPDERLTRHEQAYYANLYLQLEKEILGEQRSFGYNVATRETSDQLDRLALVMNDYIYDDWESAMEQRDKMDFSVVDNGNLVEVHIGQGSVHIGRFLPNDDDDYSLDEQELAITGNGLDCGCSHTPCEHTTIAGSVMAQRLTERQTEFIKGNLAPPALEKKCDTPLQRSINEIYIENQFGKYADAYAILSAACSKNETHSEYEQIYQHALDAMGYSKTHPHRDLENVSIEQIVSRMPIRNRTPIESLNDAEKVAGAVCDIVTIAETMTTDGLLDEKHLSHIYTMAENELSRMYEARPIAQTKDHVVESLFQLSSSSRIGDYGQVKLNRHIEPYATKSPGAIGDLGNIYQLDTSSNVFQNWQLDNGLFDPSAQRMFANAYMVDESSHPIGDPHLAIEMSIILANDPAYSASSRTMTAAALTMMGVPDSSTLRDSDLCSNYGRDQLAEFMRETPRTHRDDHVSKIQVLQTGYLYGKLVVGNPNIPQHRNLMQAVINECNKVIEENCSADVIKNLPNKTHITPNNLQDIDWQELAEDVTRQSLPESKRADYDQYLAENTTEKPVDTDYVFNQQNPDKKRHHKEMIAAVREKVSNGTYVRQYVPESVFGESSNTTFGIELECKGDDPDFGERVAQRMYEAGLSTFPSVMPYHANMVEGEYETFTVEKDASLGQDWDGHGIEIVSPVMKDTPENWAKLKRVSEIIEECGGFIDPECGGHVHIGSSHLGTNPQKYERLLSVYGQVQNGLYALGSTDGTHRTDMQNNFARKYYPDAIRSATTMPYVKRNFTYNRNTEHRYMGMNFGRAGSTPESTFEARFWDGVTTIDKIQRNIAITAGMLDVTTDSWKHKTPVLWDDEREFEDDNIETLELILSMVKNDTIKQNIIADWFEYQQKNGREI